MDIREVREMTEEQLLDAIEDKKEAIFNLRFQKASGQLEDANTLRYAKRELAQLKTVLHERTQATGEGKRNG
jgi:large subunit ribosomal protein L29